MGKSMAPGHWLAAAAVALSLVSPALADTPKAHDGFLLRVSGGVGEAHSEREHLNAQTKVSGFSGDFSLAIGFAVARNLALHGTFFGWIVNESEIDVPVPDTPPIGGMLDEYDAMRLLAVGLGITQYFMPQNVYWSVSVGPGKLKTESPGGGARETDVGFVTELALGKEWWAGGSWGLGVAAAIGFHSIPDDGVDASWKGLSYALRLTATFD